MNSTGSLRGDDFYNRLLLYFQSELNVKNGYLHYLKKGKWLLAYNTEKWFVKEYRKESHFLSQFMLNNNLSKDGFPFNVNFHPIHYRKKLCFEGKYYGLYYWVDSSSLDYRLYDDRHKALKVLSAFHKYTNQYVYHLQPYIPTFNLLEKWRKRQKEFLKNAPYFRLFIPESMLATFLYWGNYSLQKLAEMEELWVKKDVCVVHGDVAHHNFIKNKENDCYLIDFDLIAIAPKIVDDLQLSNRFLHAINWDSQALWAHDLLYKYKSNLPFLYGLFYPTGIYREWNRFRRLDIQTQLATWPFLQQMTFKKHHNRIIFLQKTGELIQELEKKSIK
ncbi:phosphotransferase [Bacillus spongiae]|uniref:Phosphotransferase n=1 Tax=Bacillus spongiae TaxID=2683610 RepID=A0ABU8H904_9BACI